MSSGIFDHAELCCICFEATPSGSHYQCPVCGALWDMCSSCGDREACLDCIPRKILE